MAVDMQRVLDLCNKSKFDEALPLLEDIVKNEPNNSEAWRILAQIHWNHLHMPDKAYDELIEALRCEPKNIWALVLMGNLLTKEKQDVVHAKKYYEKVLEFHPDNAIAINNIGATYMEVGDYESALQYMEKTLKLNATYTNAYYGLALCYYKLGRLEDSFKTCHQGALKSVDRPENPAVREELIKLFLTVAKDLADKINYINVWNGIKDELEQVDHININIIEDENLTVNARFEYAIAHGEKEHVIRYNPQKKYIDHLFVHEMMHLKMNQQATKNHRGKVVVFTPENQRAFRYRYLPFMKKRHKELPKDKLDDALRFMCEGIGTQLSSCPLDLFVEHMMYTDYEIMRPIQLLSLFHLEETNIDAIRKGESNDWFPSEIVKASKVMNIATSLHFKELYGINLINEYRPTKAEYQHALDLIEEFKAYLNTYKHGDEYEMLEYFVQSFKMEDFLDIRDEEKFTQSKYEEDYTLADEINQRLKDAPSEEDVDVLNAQFALNHQDGADGVETMMMTMHMLGAMEYFDTLRIDEVKGIAIEIATVGITGIDPKKTYTLKSIPGKEFSGYKLLAYYYVSWARSMPEALHKLQLPFDTAYGMAIDLYKNKMGKK